MLGAYLNRQGQPCVPLPCELGWGKPALVQELCSCIPAATLQIPSATLSKTQRAAHAHPNKHVLGFASCGAWGTALAVLERGRSFCSRAECQPGKDIFFFPSYLQTSLEDLTMNQSYSFVVIYRTFIQFDRSVQIFLKDRKAQNRSWFLIA